jgi:anti-anti-sigma factor
MDAVCGGFFLCVELHDDGPVVWLKGELDCATAPQLEGSLRELGGHTVTIDFSDVTFMDSSGIRVLAARWRTHGPDSVVVRGVQPAQMRVLEITGLVDLLNVNLDEA